MRVLQQYAEGERVNLFTLVAIPDGTCVSRVQPKRKGPDRAHGRCVAKATYDRAEIANSEID